MTPTNERPPSQTEKAMEWAFYGGAAGGLIGLGAVVAPAFFLGVGGDFGSLGVFAREAATWTCGGSAAGAFGTLILALLVFMGREPRDQAERQENR